MAEAQLSARVRTPSAVPRAGVTHVRARHTERFTVVGNHLAQHRELSATAIGLAVHIQSLPEGAKVGIKALAARFAEGETRVAAALRELETHGYLTRHRTRLPNGHVVTRTLCHHRPDNPPPRRPATHHPRPAPRPGPAELPAPPPPTTPPAPVPPLPEPRTTNLGRHRTAGDLLASLHHDDPRLLLPERDIRRLTPAVAAWLERGTPLSTIRTTLTTDLPHPLRTPAGLLAHRLTTLIPPRTTTTPPPPKPHPFQECRGDCGRVFRSPTPGHCRDCRPAHTVNAPWP
ncbi:helix-turn-helix domain-containing protein [Streptomyces chumphonensis]|uniref:Helix-turn-helix domain-containing protein n=1 Tax=Streptomyces chumphonensis TaxID=1214925 RepID=A0A927F4E7_9ACTN|nr:helix-turn-helix domain-containing protein [Streptomyces chumphonensis]MBD3933979.1 helix-turn-helix domain-containing protein [Streptomyces chumphonensis]